MPYSPPSWAKKTGALACSMLPLKKTLALQCTYQGTIFRSPFFFLLVDSFLLSPFVPF